MTAKPNEQYRAFEDLTKRLMTVPKADLNKKVGEYNKRKEARKRAPHRRGKRQ